MSSNEDFHAYLEIRNPQDPWYKHSPSIEISNANDIRARLEEIKIGDFFNITGLGEFVVYQIEPLTYPMATYTHLELAFVVARVVRPEKKVVDINELRERLRGRRNEIV